MNEGKIEVVENPRFMTEARRKELERRQRTREESTPVVKEGEEGVLVLSSLSSQERVSASRRNPAACS